MSSKSSAVVVPTTASGTPQPGGATAVTPMQGGGLLLSPLPLGGGKRRGSRKTKKVPKKVLKLFRKGSAKKLRKMLKGGVEAMKEVTTEEVATGETAPEATEGASRRRSRKGGKTRRHGLLY